MKNNASLARANKNIRRRKLCGKAVTVFLLVALSVVFLVPFAWMLLTSLKSMEEVYQRTIFPTKLHFDNYILAVTQIPVPSLCVEYHRHHRTVRCGNRDILRDGGLFHVEGAMEREKIFDSRSSWPR